ncbi:Fungal transcriptional regulatory protein [Cordyceps fumosorosea ARSEF 2679]|uniref:Fungal transcriptional regulatory protein n=1 Tax=Cordyceps fumosorosea (strain ARSEF 2679) TaxID=1081104 RepID=A0A168B6M7_CORFA|nr:Fungal transcriptional regulatory protein [Cordyceps fumosorosea ARSEF 2679]OAA69693.1 Fungal transcriptional regulatory protein [Cordyceps fumosorosea ARSEF 2679]
MTRHATLHGAVGKRPRKVSCVSCVKLKVRCDGEPGSACRRCEAARRPCQYRSHVDDPTPAGAPDQTDQSLASTDLSMREASMQPVLSPNPIGHASHHDARGVVGTATAFPALPVDGGVPTLNSISEPILAFPVDSSQGFSTDPSESFFGWDVGDVGSDDMDFLNVSLLEWFPTAAANEEATEPVQEPVDSDESESPSSQLMRDAQPPDTPWPHVYHPSEKDAQINLSPAAPKTPPSILQPHPGPVTEPSRQAIIALVNATHRPIWPAVDATCLPSSSTLSLCVNLYFRHFHETLPILRRLDPITSPVLLLAVAAVGAAYSRDAALRSLAPALNELARRAVERDRGAAFGLPFVQAALLQAVFGLFCGSRMLYQHAEVSRGGLVTAARRMHLLRPGLSFVQELQKTGVQPKRRQMEMAAAAAADDERRNLGWGVYLYDMQISALLNIPPLFSISEINVPLPADADGTSSSQSCTESPPSFRAVLDALLSTGELQHPLGSFSLSIIAHTLLCTDAAAVEAIFTTTPQSPGDRRYRLEFPPTLKYNPQELLDELAVACHSLTALPNALSIGVCALSHLGHVQFTWPGFLNTVKVAAGKSGTEESKAGARAWIRSRVQDDPAGARFILAQAGQLSALLARYPFDAPAETVLCLDVALTFWALLKFSSDLGGAGGGARQRPFSIFWSNCDDAGEWVKNGGAVYFQGLGELRELTSAKCLAIFRQRMGIMSWGLADRFKHVLLNLEREEQAL